MTMLGAYYSYRPLAPLTGLGSFGFGQTADVSPEEALEQALAVATPLPFFTPWARQTGETSWDEQQPTHRYVSWVVSPDQLYAVEQAAGSPVGFIAMLSIAPLSLAEVEAAFSGTPWEFVEGEAVYRQDDERPVPQIYFLYWGRLRDETDREGNSRSSKSIADALGARILWAVQGPLTGNERHHPSIAFDDALVVQTTPGLVPVTEATAPAPVTQELQSTLPWLALGFTALGAALLGYIVFKDRKRTRAA